MKRCVTVSLTLAAVLSPARGATQEDNQKAAQLYQRGLAGEAQAVVECIALLKTVLKSEPANQLARVYLGSAYTLRSRDLSFGTEKLHVLNEGLSLMDQAATAAPDNARVQLIRAVTNQSMPFFLGRRKVARDQLYALVDLIERNPSRLSADDQQLLYLNAGFAAKQSGDNARALRLWKLGLTKAADPKLTAELQLALTRM
jgi:hypothetical protein